MQGPELGAQCRAVWLRAGTLDRRRAVRVKPGRLFVAIAARGLGQRPVGQGDAPTARDARVAAPERREGVIRPPDRCR
jgi:hypothetical protein